MKAYSFFVWSIYSVKTPKPKSACLIWSHKKNDSCHLLFCYVYWFIANNSQCPLVTISLKVKEHWIQILLTTFLQFVRGIEPATSNSLFVWGISFNAIPVCQCVRCVNYAQPCEQNLLTAKETCCLLFWSFSNWFSVTVLTVCSESQTDKRKKLLWEFASRFSPLGQLFLETTGRNCFGGTLWIKQLWILLRMHAHTVRCRPVWTYKSIKIKMSRATPSGYWWRLCVLKLMYITVLNIV